MEHLLEFFSTNFKSFAWLSVFVIAMLPIAEAKVAIPFGMNIDVWGINALTPLSAGFWGFLGSIIPAIFIILFLKPVFKYLKRKKFFNRIVLFFEGYFHKKKASEVSENKTSENNIADKQNIVKDFDKSSVSDMEEVRGVHTIKKDVDTTTKKTTSIQSIITLIMFCAIPLPLAGVWTSSAIAGLSDMKFWPSFLAIAVGNLIEVVFVTTLSVFLIDSLTILILATLVILLVYVSISMVLHSVNAKKTNKAKLEI